MALSPLQLGLLLGLWVVLGLLLLAWRRARRARSLAGLPDGKVVYADSRTWQPGRVLRSAEQGLSGKPDYLVQQGRALIPIEVKPSRRADTPYEADLLQLAAYCLLVEATTGRRPPYGLLRYREETFRIPYTPALESRLCETLRAMRRDLTADEVPRSHDDPLRCRWCGYPCRDIPSGRTEAPGNGVDA